MIPVYRIEHRDTHIGFFETNDPYTQELSKKACAIRYLKAPGDDGLYLVSIPRFYVFGSSTIKALKRWVFLGDNLKENDEIVFALRDRGFVLAEFLVNDDKYVEGWSKLQLLFDADECRREGLVEYRDMTELLVESPLVFCTLDSVAELH